MNKTKKLLLAACLLFASGAILYLLALAFGSRVTGVSLDNTGLHVHSPQISGGQYNNTYKEETLSLEEFSSLEIDVNFADVTIETSGDLGFGLSYRMADTSVLTHEIRDGRLKVVQTSKNGVHFGTNITLFGGFDYFENDTVQNELTIYLPSGTQLSDFSATCGSTDFTASGLYADHMKLKLNFGNVDLRDLKSVDCSIDLDSADLTLTDGQFTSLDLSDNFGTVKITGISAAQPSVIDVDSSDVTINDAEFADLEFSSSFGSLTGNNVTVKHLRSIMDSGDADLKYLTCDSLYMKSAFGSIDLLFTKPLKDYSYSLSTQFGKIRVDGKDLGTAYRPLFEEETESLIEIKCDSGDITIDSPEDK